MVVAVVASLVLLLAAGYLNWTARRLDRLHRSVDASAAALTAALDRRALAAAALARGELPETLGLRLAACARACASATALGHDREVRENALTRCLVAVAAEEPRAVRPGTAAADALLDAAARVAVARRFYNDAVRGALAVRRRRLPRWLHLAGRASWPSFFEIDDTLPTFAGPLPVADAP